MKIRRLDEPIIPRPCDLVKYKLAGNVREIRFSGRHLNGGTIKKLDKESYVNIRTGEVKEFTHHQSRKDDIDNVKKTLTKGRDMINANVFDVSYCKWITLTYAVNMTDPDRLYKDYKLFNTRLRRKYGACEYITAAEPQGRGAWHLHVLLIFDHPAPYMSNNDVAQLWGQGFVKVKKLDNVDNVGAYLTAYLGDLECIDNDAPEELVKTVSVFDDTGHPVSKRFIKGARLSMYPPGFHIFRWSRGCKKPVIKDVEYQRAKKEVGGLTPTYIKSIQLTDAKTDFTNVLSYEFYNLKRN